MKKKLALILVVALMLGLTACGAKEEAAEASVQEGGKTFTVGFDAEFPPYGYMDDNGEYVGFDLELAQEVCNRRG